MRLFLAVALLVCLTEAKWWMEQPYGDDEFNVRVEYGEDTTIQCEDPRINGTSYTVEFWVLPDLTLMRGGDSDVTFRTIDGDAGWSITDDSKELELFLVQEAHFGFYHCLAVLDNPIIVNGKNETHFLVKRATNFKGPYFDDLWADYEMNVIIGCSSAAAFLVICGSIYGFFIWYGKRSDSRKVGVEVDDDAPEMQEIEKQETSTSNGMDNAAFTTEQETAFTEKPPMDSAQEPVVDQPQPATLEETA